MQHHAINSYNVGFSDLLAVDGFKFDLEKITESYSNQLYNLIMKYTNNGDSMKNAALRTYVVFQRDNYPDEKQD